MPFPSFFWKRTSGTRLSTINTTPLIQTSQFTNLASLNFTAKGVKVPLDRLNNNYFTHLLISFDYSIHLLPF